MKKNIVLSMIVLTLLVVPVFAEPTFSGSFSYGFHYDVEADDPKPIYENGDHNASIDFTAAISEFTELSAKMKGSDNDTVKVEHMILSQDVTGALGIDAPVAFSFKVGKQDYAPADYSHFKDPGAKLGINVEPELEEKKVLQDLTVGTETNTYQIKVAEPIAYDATDLTNLKLRGTDSKEIGLIMTFDVLEGMLKLDTVLYPKSLMDDNDDSIELGVALSGAAGPAKYSAYYAKSDRFESSDFKAEYKGVAVPVTLVDKAGDTIDSKGDVMGLNFDLTFGDFVTTVLADYDLDAETAMAAISAGYSIVGLTATVGADIGKIGIKKEDNGGEDWDAKKNLDVDLDLAYAIGGFETKAELRTSLDEPDVNSNVKLTLAYTLGDAVFYGAAKMGTFKDFDVEDHLAFEAGLKYTLDSVAFNLGYTKGSDYKAYYDSVDHKRGVYFNVSTSF